MPYAPSKYCSQCGTPCQPGRRFCSKCGSLLSPDTPDANARPGPPAAAQPAAFQPAQTPAASAPAPGTQAEPPTLVGYPQQPPAQGYPSTDQRAWGSLPTPGVGGQPPAPQGYPQQVPYQQPPAPQGYPPQGPYQQPPQGVYPQQPPLAQGAYPPAYPQQQPAVAPPPVRGVYPPAYPPQGMAPYPRPRRRGRGCLWGCLATVFMVVVLVGGVGLWLWLVPPKSKNLALGHKESLVQSTVSASGGTVVVQQPGHALDGLKIDVPSGAYAQDTAFKVSARPIEDHRFGADFTPITPLIRVDNGHGFAAEPMTLEIPIQLAEGEFALAFFYDQVTGKLEGIPLVDLTRDKITVLTAHFSDIVVSKIDGTRLEDLIVDTGFRPGVDDWQFPNRGSIVAPRGHCAGQSISAMWYYVEQRKGQNKPPLNGNYDNNNLRPATPTLWQDDAWGYRFASSVQRTIDWSPWSAKVSRYLGGLDDTLTLSAFAYAMLITGEPQYVSIGRYEVVEGESTRYGHALVAYKIENGKIHIADPNYAGQEGRVIPFAESAFRPYASGDDVDEIEVAGPKDYTEIRYLAKSALVDWARVGELYQDMLRDEAGKGIFPAYTLKVFTGLDENGDQIWVDFPRVIEIGEDQTAQAGEELRGKLQVKIAMAADTEMRLQALRGSQPLFDPINIVGSADGKIKLEPGVNDLGFYIQVKDPKYGAFEFEDFWRVKVIYGPVDLTGTWEGVWQVQDAGKILRYIEDLIVRFLLWTTLVEDEQTAREAAAASMEEDASLYAERPFRIIFDQPDPKTPNRYPVRVTTLNDDGTTEEMPGEAIYDQGEVHFTVRHSDGSKMECVGLLTGNQQLDGEFAIHAWGGVVQDAALGRWQVTRQP